MWKWRRILKALLFTASGICQTAVIYFAHAGPEKLRQLGLGLFAAVGVACACVGLSVAFAFLAEKVGQRNRDQMALDVIQVLDRIDTCVASIENKTDQGFLLYIRAFVIRNRLLIRNPSFDDACL